MEESSSGQCLLCLGNPSPPNEEEGTPFSLLGRQLKAVFVLRELLRLPPEKLTRFLERSGGDHPHQWIRFCDLCQALVEEAFSLYEEQIKIHRKWKKVQQEVVNNVRESQIGGDAARDAIAQETRSFVNNYDYGPFESRFVVGDWEAEWRVVTLRSAPKPDPVKEEVEDEEGNLNDNPASGSDEEEAEYQKYREGIHGNQGKNGRFRCPLCPARYTCKKGRWKHVHRRHEGQTHVLKYLDNQKPLSCPRCHKEFKGRKGLAFHERRLGADCTKPEYLFGGACPFCQREFPTALKLRHHQRYSQCRTGVPFKRMLVLKSEMFVEESTGQTRYRCSIGNCGKIYGNRHAFRVHKKNHQNSNAPSTGERWRTCEVCQDKFLGNLGLAVHHKRAHPELRPPKTSPESSKQPPQKAAAVGVGEEPGGMKKWRRFVRPCPQCPYTGTRDMVEAHVKRVHEGGQYRFHCEHCGQGLTTPTELKLHRAAKHFICGLKNCGVQMESQEGLHAHQVGAHGGEVHLFKCDQCDKLWTTKRKRERHRRQVHLPKNAEQHMCEQCGKTFPLKEYLQNHVWHAHKAKKSREGSENPGQ